LAVVGVDVEETHWWMWEEGRVWGRWVLGVRRGRQARNSGA
jgi:hypothetical protein